MDRITHFFEACRLWLENDIGTGSAFAVLCILVFAFVYLFRKFLPNQWIWLVKRVPYLSFDETPLLAFLDKALQTIPGAVFAAIMGALSTGGNVKAAALAALAAPLATIGHHILAAIPWIPYLGRLGSAAKRRFTPPPTGTILAFIAAVGFLSLSAVSACGFFGANGPLYPAAVKCLPPAAEAEDVVKNVLLAGLDGWKSALDQAALKYGPSTVLCIVNNLVSDWGAPGSPTRESARAQAGKLRGDEFLKDHPAKVEQ